MPDSNFALYMQICADRAGEKCKNHDDEIAGPFYDPESE